jgi:glycerol-3-phosphate acyltransferase PlsY
VELTVAIALAYLLGSVPFAYLIARTGGVDLRKRGSGNVGATNVLRTLGVTKAVTAMGLDATKGAVAVALASSLVGGMGAPAAAGVASVVGHVYPMWLGFRGGKGVATAAGVFAVLAPLALVVACGVFLVTVWLTRYISMGSLVGAASLTAISAATTRPWTTTGAAAAVTLLIVHRHRENLRRVWAGTERRVGLRGV